MQVTGELTTGAIGIIVTILFGIVASWVRADRQSTRFDVMIAAMQKDIQTNRDSFSIQLTEIRQEFKATNKSIDDLKLQFAAMGAMQNMANMFKSLPEELARAMGEARGRKFNRNDDDKAA